MYKRPPIRRRHWSSHQTWRRPADLVTKLDTFSKKFGQTINKSKTEVQVINRERINISIRIDDKPLNQVENFIYLYRGNIWNPYQWKWDQKKSRISHRSHPEAKAHIELQSHEKTDQTWIVQSLRPVHSYIRCRDMDIKEIRWTETQSIWNGLPEKDPGSDKIGIIHQDKGKAKQL